MKKLLLLLFLPLAFNSIAQTVLFEDSFELNSDFAIANFTDNWTVSDIDLQRTYGFQGTTFANSGVPKSFQAFNATTTTPPITTVSAAQDWNARTGNLHMVCFASTGVVPPSTVVEAINDDWLFSPQITLGTSNVLTFWAKACNFQYKNEKFNVWVSTTDTNISSFTKISTGDFITTPTISWVEYTYNLSAAYNNIPIYIAIHCQSDDQFGFAIDDFKVIGTQLSNQDFFSSNFSIYPNPAKSVINLTSKNSSTITNVQITDLNGRIVKEVSPSNVSETQINVSDLNAGVYFVKAQTENGVGTTKIVKQ